VTSLHAALTADGLVVVRILPASSIAAHSELDGHEIAASAFAASTWAGRHGDAIGAAVGAVEVMMSRLASPTQSDADGHDPTAAPGAAVIVHAAESPAGSVELITTVRCESGPVPLAIHSCDEGHENAPTELTPGRLTSFHAPVPPPGLVELMTCPAPSEDTHNDTDGHVIE
jgi:hypothetical protein